MPLVQRNVTCIPIDRRRVGKHIPATYERTTIERLLLGNGAVNRLREVRAKWL
jgi:hypothetical protein